MALIIFAFHMRLKDIKKSPHFFVIILSKIDPYRYASIEFLGQ